MEYMFLPFKRYAEFTGRSRRMEYWMFTLFNIIVFAVLVGISAATGSFDPAGISDPNDPLAIYGMLFSGIGGILLAIYWLAILIPSIAVNVRRLHDRDMSGWWYLGFIVLSLIPFIGFLISIGYLVLMFLPGTDGPNRFGPDPKGGADSAVFD